MSETEHTLRKGVCFNVRRVRWVHSLGGCVPDYLRAVLPARTGPWLRNRRRLRLLRSLDRHEKTRSLLQGRVSFGFIGWRLGAAGILFRRGAAFAAVFALAVVAALAAICAFALGCSGGRGFSSCSSATRSGRCFGFFVWHVHNSPNIRILIRLSNIFDVSG